MAMRHPEQANVTSYETIFEEAIAQLERVTDVFRTRLYALRLANDPDFHAQVQEVERREQSGTADPGLTKEEFAERYGVDADALSG